MRYHLLLECFYSIVISLFAICCELNRNIHKPYTHSNTDVYVRAINVLVIKKIPMLSVK